MPRIQLVTTGGTIASRAESAQVNADVVASVRGEALRAGLHDRLDGIEIAVDDFCSVNSFSIDLPLAFSLAKRIDEHLADPACDGVVVTHGTDTMEESAWLADLVALDEKGFVLTGPAAEASSPYATSRPGIYAVGDVRAGSTKRVASSVGEGSVVISAVWEHVRGGR